MTALEMIFLLEKRIKKHGNEKVYIENDIDYMEVLDIVFKKKIKGF
ncbi:MAG TPA: hypothetical protein VGB37_03015 [Candidatus Lokiarchaeia archaeon]